ncbi:F0F1 ATP synthase subunit A [Microbacterium caowuchunii]|uniref:ATP synthase subunit a n=1 Tax=Microbacterium caowuchunii TaxID=2614638 RepID=A0A5N0T5C2_9MICO|nr:F0F1 ATP synthase subunit A [Microbacterium caowuchunii]KAA9130031.1 F0F1 ATP synthase subunit A [Microbacterium caowuchunii]
MPEREAGATPLTQATSIALTAASDNEFHPPSIGDFSPPALLFEGTVFEFTRINLAQVLATIVLVLFLLWGTRRMTVVPGRFQSVVEMGFGFVRDQVVYQILGERDGRRFLPILTAIFFGILFMNLTGVIPGINIPGTSVAGVPLMLALVAYVLFIYAGIRKHGGFGFLKSALVPSGVPIYLLPIIVVVEIISTFIARPVSLFLRLLMNMMVGHMMLVLFFAATHFFLLSFSWLSPLAIGTFALGLAFTLFEIFVCVLQAYVFTVLTSVYIQLAVADEH